MKNYRKPHRIKKKKSIFRNQFFWLFLFIFTFILIILYFLFFSSFFQIKKIEIYGTQKTSEEQIRNFVLTQIEKKIGPFYSKSIFLLNSSRLTNFILTHFPQISKIRIQKRIPSGIFIKIEEREPVAIFVKESDKFLVDKTGVIFEKIELDDKLLKIISDITPSNLEFGKKVITKEQLSLILDLKLRLKKDFEIEAVEVLIISEDRFNLKTSEGWFIYFNFTEIDWQITKLKIILDKEIPKEKRKELEYIDLRFGNLAPYKYR